MSTNESMKMLTDLVFGKTVPKQSWQEYERDAAEEAKYYNEHYGLGKGSEDEQQ